MAKKAKEAKVETDVKKAKKAKVEMEKEEPYWVTGKPSGIYSYEELEPFMEIARRAEKAEEEKAEAEKAEAKKTAKEKAEQQHATSYSSSSSSTGA